MSSNKTPLFNKVVLLRKQLIEANKVTDRREAAEDLLSLLGDPQNRRHLILEVAVSKDGGRAATQHNRHLAVSNFWQVLLKIAIKYVKLIRNGKAKIRTNDILLPFQLLKLCDIPVYVQEPSKLSKPITKELLEFCLDMLDDVPALNLDGLQDGLLQMLAYECSRQEFVSHFRPDQQMTVILEEVETRLLADNEPISQLAAKVFYNLMKTAENLGIGLHLFVSGSLNMVAKWTKKKSENLETIHLLLGGVSVLLSMHPDLSVAPLTRYGRPLVSLAKRSLAVKLSRQQSMSSLSFLTNYVIVCQVAGQLQGRMVGDLGDLGSASLTYKSICFMIESLLAMSGTPEPERHDLIARLLSIGQRVFLSQTEWEDRKDAINDMEKEIEQKLNHDDHFTLDFGKQSHENHRCCSEQDLSESPFALYILSGLHPKVDQVNESQDSGTESATMWKRAMQRLSNDEVAEQGIVVRIDVLKAAAKLFPLGACWTSSSNRNWISIDYEKNGLLESRLVNGGSPDDLSSVIDVLGDLLERTGTSKSLVKIQGATLACLIRLAEASKVSFHLSRYYKDSAGRLATTLRKVWTTLTSGDFFYGPLTKRCEKDSIGDLVLRLLTQISCFPGFQSSELRTMQSDVWNLPALSWYATKSPSLFQLIHCIARRSSWIVDTKQDTIMCPESLYKWFPRLADLQSRLSLYCIAHYQIEEALEEDVAVAVSLCISALLKGIHLQYPFVQLSSGLHSIVADSEPSRGNVVPNTMEEDMMQALWGPLLVERTVHTAGCNHDPVVPNSLPFCLQLTSKAEQKAEIVVADKKRSQLVLKALEQYLRVSCAPDDVIDARSVSGCLLSLKMFATSCIEDSSSIESISLCFAALWNRVNFELSTEQELTLFLKFSCQLVRFLVKTGNQGWPTQFSTAVSDVQQFTLLVLSQFSCSADTEALEPKREEGLTWSCSVKHRDNHFEDQGFRDFELERHQPRSGKRKAEDQGKVSAWKRPYNMLPNISLTQVVAYHAASLLLAINPEFDKIAYVCQILTGLDSPLVESADNVPIDIEGGKYLIFLLCSDLMFMDEGSLNVSVASLAIKIITMIRCRSPPESSDHLFGFEFVEQIVQLRDGSPTCRGLNKDEAESLIRLLDSSEKRSLSYRPNMRSSQIAASAKVFEIGQASLHKQFDGVFTSKLVSPFLLDINATVRKNAAISVGFALEKLDKSEIIESVRRELAPVIGHDESYSDWYSRRLGTNEETKVAEKQVFEDARPGFIYDVLSTFWVVIIMKSGDSKVIEQVVFDYVRLSSVIPELQPLCFQAVDKLARLLGFEDAENLLAAYRRSIARKWLDTKESLFEIPTLVTAPNLVRQLLLFNRRTTVFAHSDTDSAAFERLNDFASSKFLELALDDFVPAIVLSAVAEIVKAALTTEGRRCLLHNEYLRQMSSIFFDQFDDETVRKVLVKAQSALSAEHFTLQHSQVEEQIHVAKYLGQLLDRIIVKDSPISRPVDSVMPSLKKAVKILGSPGGGDYVNIRVLLGGLESRNEGLLYSTVEILIFSYSRLLRAKSNIQRLQRWQPIDQITAHISSTTHHTNGQNFLAELVFCLKLLSDCLAKCELRILQTKLLHSLKSLLVTAARTRPTSEKSAKNSGLSRAVKSLLGTIINLQSCQQRRIIDGYRKWKDDRRRSLAAMDGLVPTRAYDTVDVWGWQQDASTNDCSVLLKIVSSDTLQLVDATFDVINFLINNKEELMLPASAIVWTWRQVADEIETLHELRQAHPELAATLLLKQFSDESQGINTFPDLSLIDQPSNQTQRAEIEEIERSLRLWKSGEPTDFKYDMEQTNRLVDSLVRIAICENNINVRCAASRCLGELYPFIPRNRLCNKDKEDEAKILRQRYYAVLEQCARTVFRFGSETLYLALETFKSLSGTRRDKISSQSPFSEATSLLEVVRCADENFEFRSELCLSETEVMRLRESFSENDTEYWCWREELWNPFWQDPAAPFDTWICRLTTSLIVSLYGADDSQSNVAASFITQCQKLSYLDSSFATEVFKSLTVHVMLCDDDSVSFAQTSREEIRNSLSGGFRIVLENYRESEEQRYLETIVDVLDTLRQVSQDRFIRDPNTSDRNDSDSFRLPYGVIARLDGMVVATACVRVKRYEQALFYADLYADARFGRSADITSFPDMKRQGTGDISGRFRHAVFEKADLPAINDDYASYLKLLYKSFKGLEQSDSCRVVEDFQADLAYLALSSEDFHVDHGLKQLEKLDNLIHGGTSWTSRWSLAECLAGMDLKATMGYYMEGLIHGDNKDFFGEAIASSEVCEKAAEVRIYKKQWDNACFNDDAVTQSRTEPPNRCLGFNSCIDRALDSLRRDEGASYQDDLSRARLAVLDELSAQNMFTPSSSLRHCCSRFSILNALDHLSLGLNLSPSFLQNLCVPRNDEIESGLAADDIAEAALRSLPSRIEVPLKETLVRLLELKFERCLALRERKRGHGILARLRSIYSLDKLSCEDITGTVLRLRLKEARLLERSNDVHTAIRLVKLATKSCTGRSLDLKSLSAEELFSKTPHGILPLVAEAALLCGVWTAKYRVEPSTFILNYQKYAIEFSKAAMKLPNGQTFQANLVQAYCVQSELASSLYEAAKSRVQSIEWQESETTLHEREDTLKNLAKTKCSKSGVTGEDQLRYARELCREIESTRRQRSEFQSAVESYRLLSMESSFQALLTAGTEVNKMSKYMYSFVSLLFACAEDNSWSMDIDSITEQATKGIPSFRFVELYSQLLSRLGSSMSNSEKALHCHLTRIVKRVSADHPYHCTMQLIAASKSREGESSQSEKVRAATEILMELSKSEPTFKGQLIDSQSLLFDAYVYLALANSDQFQRGATQTISFQTICKENSPRLDRLSFVRSRTQTIAPCVSTKIPDVRPRCDYGSGVTDPVGSERIKAFDPHFAIASSGVSRPKIVVCIGMKGGRYKQLVKGGDDTRQDAVMEQVFQYVNSLLCDERESRPHQGELSVATYNVIPLTPKAGVLEWVDYCAAFAHYVIGKTNDKAKGRRIPTAKSGAHERYYPDEWSMSKCNGVLSDPKNKRRLREVYDEVCRNFSPVYRYFFVERFAHSAELWFQAKMRYTKSVATSSIVGHILGIGDRHGSNIMVHQRTGEVIHIDFGIVFEQGKRLQTPEKVPFRLTRNIVDGMGPLGTKGVFTTAAETTLEVLKENSNALLTILSAIVSDPLYKWTLGIGKESKAGRNAAAALVISRIQEKLQGYEEGTHGEQQTVSGQVQLLVNEAKDPNNLCRMYCGWGPHC